MIIIDYSYPPNVRKRFKSTATSIILGRISPRQPVDLDLTPDVTVSRRHARLTYEQGEYWLEDLNSKYGTWVNGRSIAGRTRIAPGDKIQLGHTTLELMAQDAPTRPTRVSLKHRSSLDIAHAFPDEGLLTNIVSATASPTSLLRIKEHDQTSLEEAVWRRLSAFYELSVALGSMEAVESLLETVIEHLCSAIPDAQRGALLLQEGPELLPKAYAPRQTRPAISFNLARLAMAKQEAFIWRFGISGETGLFDSVVMHGTQAAMYAPLIWQGEVLGVVLVDNFRTRYAFNGDDLRLLMAMANQAAMFVKNYALQQDLRHQEVVRSNLLRQFSPQVAERLESLLREKGHLQLGGKRADPVTILASDVRGFTALSAEMEPDEVVDMLNELFGVCIPIIFKYNGTVDKYVGDAILAVFGSPDPDDRQWENAVRAALEMQQAIEKLRLERQGYGLPICQVGIGIHTGAVLHGFIGSEERMEYTVIGDTVNRASRYCDGAGRGEVVISEAVYAHVSELIEASPKHIQAKHPDIETEVRAYLVKALKPLTGRSRGKPVFSKAL